MALTSVAFALAFACGCLMAFVRHPIYGLMTYVAVFYLHPPARWWGEALPDMRWSLLAAVVTLIALLVAPAMKRTAAEARAVIEPTRPPTPLFGQGIVIALVLFTIWLAIQSLWALDRELHLELLTLIAKYTLLVALIYKCVDSERHLRMFLWSHVFGCCYLGWLVFGQYIGGRFEGFGAPNIDEANAGALQVVTGIFVASALLLSGQFRERAFVFGSMPFIVNALVATISRSGFLAAAFGGLVFNLFTPSQFRWRVRVLSVLAVVLFALLTNPTYWARISSLSHAGEEAEGVDTGSGRVALVAAQWQMFQRYPLGCGHRCTAVLSREFLDDKHLTGTGEHRARSSHSTPMTMLVEQGVPGAVLYLLLLLWIWKSLRKLGRMNARSNGFVATLVPAVAAALGAITISDLFIDNLRLEVRFWFIGAVMVLLRFRSESLPAAAGSESRGGSHSGRTLRTAAPR